MGLVQTGRKVNRSTPYFGTTAPMEFTAAMQGQQHALNN